MALAYRAMAGNSDISRIRNELYVLSFQKASPGNAELQLDTQLPLICTEVDGWVWHAKIFEGRYQWVKMSFTGATKKNQPGSDSRAANVAWRLATKPAGSGFFLAGDAAAVLDPASSHGVLRAVMTAHIARKIHDTPSEEPQLIQG